MNNRIYFLSSAYYNLYAPFIADDFIAMGQYEDVLFNFSIIVTEASYEAYIMIISVTSNYYNARIICQSLVTRETRKFKVGSSLYYHGYSYNNYIT